MNEELHETIKEIKKKLRLAMNGVVSTLQRRQGLNYKINFGVEIPRLKELASQYAQERALAQELWQANIRECKLLAIFLYPTEGLSIEEAEKWIAESPFTEISDHLCRTLLKSLANAKEHCLRWITHESDTYKYCGYTTLSHLLRSGEQFNESDTATYAQAVCDIFAQESTASQPTRNAAYTSLVKYMDNDSSLAGKIGGILASKKDGKENSLSHILENISEF